MSQLATYGSVAGRLESFGLTVYEVNGNEISEVMHAVTMAKKVAGGPAIIVANTTGGKGVSFMENDPKWHDKVPSNEELEQALKELQ